MSEDCKKKKRTRVALSSLAVGVFLTCGFQATAQETHPVSPDLTPKLRELLRKEMLSIEQASKDIISALIAGDDARVASLAQQIHDSFILQQSMTPQDKQDLKAAVPKEFVTRDQAFHQLSADLAQAGRDDDREAQNARFSQMIGACTACHTRYATDRFPMLAK